MTLPFWGPAILDVPVSITASQYPSNECKIRGKLNESNKYCKKMKSK